MALVSVSVRASYFGAIVAQLTCLVCLGAKQLADANGFLRYCERCHGSGMADLDREVAYAQVHMERLRKRMMETRFDGRG